MMQRSVMAAAVLGVFAAGRAEAAFIAYTESVVASGTLDGVAFTNAPLTLSATGDTAGIVLSRFPGVIDNPVSVSFAVAGTGGGTLDGPYVVFVSLFASAAGISSGRDVLDVSNVALAPYGLDTAIGPLTGAATIDPGAPFASSAGDLVLNSVSGNATFVAVGANAAVPEPASAVLMGLGLVGLGLVGGKRFPFLRRPTPAPGRPYVRIRARGGSKSCGNPILLR